MAEIASDTYALKLKGLMAVSAALPIALYGAATAGTRNSLDVVEGAGRDTYSKVGMSFGEVALAFAAQSFVMPADVTQSAVQTGALVAAYDYYQFEDAKSAGMTAVAVAASTYIGQKFVFPRAFVALTKWGLI